MEEVVSNLINSDCAILHVQENPLRFIVAKKYKNKDWVVRKVKGNPLLTKKQVLNGLCRKNVGVKTKMTKTKAIELFNTLDQNLKQEIRYINKGKQWKSNDFVEGIDYINSNYIFTAVAENDLNKVQESVILKLNLNFKDKEGYTALHYAASGGNLSIIEYLIKNGAKVNVVNKLNELPIHMALNSKVVKMLIKYKSKVNVKDKITGATPLMRNALEDDLDSIKILVKNKADVNLKDSEGVSPLQVACSLGNLEMVKFLVNNKANINNIDKKGDSPLSYAALYHYPKIAKYLLSKKAKVTEKTQANAIMNNKKSMMDLFKLKSKKKNKKSCLKDHKNANNPNYICNPLSGKWVTRSGNLGKIIEMCCE